MFFFSLVVVGVRNWPRQTCRWSAQTLDLCSCEIQALSLSKRVLLAPMRIFFLSLTLLLCMCVLCVVCAVRIHAYMDHDTHCMSLHVHISIMSYAYLRWNLEMKGCNLLIYLLCAFRHFLLCNYRLHSIILFFFCFVSYYMNKIWCAKILC